MIYKDINIKELFKLMQEHDIAETTLQNGKITVVVKRNKEPVIMNTDAVLDRSYPRILEKEALGAPVKPEADAKNSDAAELGSETPASPGEAFSGNYHRILTPLVGTFYRASAPDVDAFVEVGDQVDVGDVMCIVEAMKSMNEIQSDVKGVVKEICVENGQMVEYEQMLFKIAASS